MNYITEENKLYRNEEGKPISEIANFDFEILEDKEFIFDENISTHVYKIKVFTENNEIILINDVNASDYDSGKWVTKAGSKAVVLNKNFFNQSVIPNKLRNSNAKHVKEHKYVGYYKKQDGDFIFVDNGGSISKSEYTKKVKSSLNQKLGNFKLPRPARDYEKKIDSIRAVLELGKLSDSNSYIGTVSKALIVGAVISPFLENKPPVFFIGETGSRKSALASVIQSFYGSAFSSASQLCMDWSSTEAALEDFCLAIRNCVGVIDEFTPKKGINENELGKKAEQIIRGIANGVTKQRSNSKGILQPKREPGVWLLITGESMTLKVASSLLTRVVFLPIKQGDVNLDVLSYYQKLGADNTLSQFTSSIIRFFLKNQKNYQILY